MNAVLLISHGSQSPKTKIEIDELVSRLKSKSGVPIMHYAFLEIESPSIPEGIDQCVRDGAKNIVVLLNFLNAGRHVDEDIPRIIREARQKYPDTHIRLTPPVGRHPNIVDLFLEMMDS